jgi:transposase
MVRRQISEAQRWQIIGMHTTGKSYKAIGHQMGYHYTVVSRLVKKHTQTNNVKDLPRSGRPRVTSDCDDRPLQLLVRRMPFATSPVLKQHWLPNRRLSTRTVRNRLKSAGLKSLNHYWASTVSWVDVPWGIGCIFVSPNPHPAVGYMKQKPALVWPMDLVPYP